MPNSEKEPPVTFGCSANPETMQESKVFTVEHHKLYIV